LFSAIAPLPHKTVFQQNNQAVITTRTQIIHAGIVFALAITD
jgi:hypothetical protein